MCHPDCLCLAYATGSVCKLVRQSSKYRRYLSRESAARQTLIIAGASLLSQSLVVLITPLLTRTYDPQEFAFFAVYTAVSLIFGPAIVLRMDIALGLPQDKRDGTAVAWLGLIAAFFLSGALMLAGFLYGPEIGAILHSPTFGHLHWLVVLGTLVLALDQISLGWMIRHKRYAAVARRSLFSGVAQASTQLLFGYLDVANGLVIGLLIGRLAAVGGVLGKDGLLRQPVPRLRELRTSAGRYRRFMYVSSWSTLINGVGIQAPVLVISACYGKLGVAELGLAIRVLSAPLAIVGMAVGRVFQGHISESVRLERPDIVKRLRRTAILLAILGATPATILITVGPALFSAIFGEQWRGAGQLAAALAIGLYAQFIVSPISQVPTLLERQGLQIAWDIMRMFGTIAVPLAVFYAGASIVVATAALGVTFAVLYASFYLMSDRLAFVADRRFGELKSSAASE